MIDVTQRAGPDFASGVIAKGNCGEAVAYYRQAGDNVACLGKSNNNHTTPTGLLKISSLNISYQLMLRGTQGLTLCQAAHAWEATLIIRGLTQGQR
jgi:hypothetical protein